MKLSVIVPAYNESKRISACLAHLNTALRAMEGLSWELIVVDNKSTDSTPALARQAGATVVFEPVNQIAKARNAGGRAASGDWLLFVDADTHVSPETLREMLCSVGSGRVVGGGTILRYDRSPGLWRWFLWVSNHLVIPLLRWTPGCFIFCRRDAFREVGGFDERLFAGEDVEFGKAMKRWGKKHRLQVAILRRHPPVTSMRKLELYGSREVFILIFRWLVLPRRTLMDKRHLHVFYDGRR
jgi:glycosyltransferase involved in cell wall biosynthesis